MDAPLRCMDCGALWYSRAAAALAESDTKCLACNGQLVQETSSGADGDAGGTAEADE